VDTFDFGEVNWSKLGFNLDGLVSTAASKDLCIPASGGDPNMVYPDGDNGIDNAFGKSIVPLLGKVMMGGTLSSSSNDSVANGEFSMLLDFVKLTAAADQPSVVTRLYGGTDLGEPPSFNGKDCWPVAPELLTSPTDITSSTVVFKNSALAAQSWTSGTGTTVKLSIPITVEQLKKTVSISLTLNKAQMALTFAADHKSATGGVLGGVLDTEEFIKEIKKAVFSLLGNLGCSVIMSNNVEASIRQASDIMNNGTQDKLATCNGISIGFGFTMKEVQLGGVGPAAPPATGTCQ
jgi:hypothetical protein